MRESISGITLSEAVVGCEVTAARRHRWANRSALRRLLFLHAESNTLGPASARMAQKLATETGKARYRRRKVIPEPVFG